MGLGFFTGFAFSSNGPLPAAGAAVLVSWLAFVWEEHRSLCQCLDNRREVHLTS